MKKYNYLGLFLFLLFIFSAPNDMFSKGTKKNTNKRNLHKLTANPQSSVMNINNITSWVDDQGFHNWVVGGGSWNGAFPNGANLGAIFSEGIVWGGKVTDGQTPEVRVNGNTYSSGTFAITRLFRVRPDYETGDLSRDAASFFQKDLSSVTNDDITNLRNQYAIDWNEWPADEGAAYEDVDGDGAYDPSVDIPGIPGAAQTIFIKYDDSNSENIYGSPPIGFEVSETYWGYALAGALSNVIYKKVEFVYVGTDKSSSDARIDSMYIVQWSDPDVGNSTDDFAGCDTTLNLGYSYSAGIVDADYAGLGFTPAVGFDFLQGVSQFTGNPDDSAMYNLHWRKGYKYVNEKPMSSFVYFAAGGAWSDPSFDYNGTLEFFNLMRGRLPDPPYPSADPFPDGVVDVTATGTFLLAGDPVAGTGKIDGGVEGPGDRRIMVTNGPITMTIGDTAQVVVALVGGMGATNLSAVTAVKSNDFSAQLVFDNLFQLPSIKPPKVNLTEMHNSIILNWGGDVDLIENIESTSIQGYNFEGYEVVQLPSPSASIADGVPVAIFDIPNGVTSIYDNLADANGTEVATLMVNGSDNGISRYVKITRDEINKTDLRDGQDYYYVVVSYAHNPTPPYVFHALLSTANVIVATPHEPNAGVRYGSTFGESLDVVHTAGESEGVVTVQVIEPAITTGHDYSINFSDSTGTRTWSVKDINTDKLVIDKLTNQSGGDSYYPVIDGLQFKVISPEVAQGASFTSVGDVWLTGGIGSAGALMDGAAYLGSLNSNGAKPSNVSVLNMKSIRIDMAPIASYTDENSNNKYDVGEPYTVNPDSGQIAYIYKKIKANNYEDTAFVPFKVYDISSNPERQLTVVVLDRNRNIQWDPDGIDTVGSGTRRLGNYVFVLDTPYDSTGNIGNPNSSDGHDYMDEINTGSGPMLWTMYWGTNVENTIMANSFSMTFVPNVNTPADVFTFTSPLVDSNATTASTDLNKINVFPNPYYGYNNRELSREDHYVTFNHLPPAKTTIRIFDLAGVLVRTIDHPATNGQFERWDLQNNDGFPVASGIYIVYIEMPSYGVNKILKVAIVQEQQILKVY